MIEGAEKIFEYLPIEKDKAYLDFLWETCECNFEKEKYQFSYLAYHMLFMMFVYFSIWKIKTVRPECFYKALIGFGNDIEKKFIDAITPFDFSELKERSMLRFLKLVGFNNGHIGLWGKIIDDRNKMAHSNGHIYLKSEEQLREYVEKILKCIDDIQCSMKDVVQAVFEKALRDEDESFEHFQQILLFENYFSKQDMGSCLDFDFNIVVVRGRKRLMEQIRKQQNDMYAVGNE
ncbi:MAG: hypothetical protein AB1650_01670 [Candidatus Omnitrophota bacterium]